MGTNPTCQICGKPLEPNAPDGLCPECLMRGAFPTGTDSGGKTPRFIPPTIAELAPKFPQLDILEFIGQGGMGAVYKARQKQLDRIVALKILPPQTAGGPGFAERFSREARALAMLNHPHIVTLYEFGQADGLFYFLMEFVDGITLRRLLNNGRIAPKEALAIVPQICEALQYAHERGVVHRDIKPENILLSREGAVKIADFGVAKIVTQESETTGQGASPRAGELTHAGSLGTPQYMAPEQLRNSAEVDHRADIYSLGLVFYQMLTDELPDGKIEPPSKKVVIDVRLDHVVLRALEQQPALRYQQAGEVKQEVETIAATSGAPAPPAVPSPRRRQKGMMAAAVVIGALLLVILYYAVDSHSSIKSDYIGSTWFPGGDSIKIISVRRTENQITVLGHYNLVSRPKADLALHITSSFVGHHQTTPEQAIKISKGEGDFELTHSHPVPGEPHVSMYDNRGHDFASVYFGTEAEALKEKKNAALVTNKPVASIPPKVVSVSPTNGSIILDPRQELHIRFDRPMNPDRMSLAWLKGGGMLSGTVRYDSAHDEFVIPVGLSPGTNNPGVNIRNDAFDIGFRSADGVRATKFTWQFVVRTSEPKPGDPKPVVTAISPAVGETLPVLTRFEITFDQPMMPPEQSPPSLRQGKYGILQPPYIISAFEYDAAAHRYTVPVVLPPDNETKLFLEGFKSASGVPCAPVVISCNIGTNDYSRAEQDRIAAAAKDPRLTQLLNSMQAARARLNSGVETVQTLLSFGGDASFFQDITENKSTFMWQGTNQVVADISDEMSMNAFILGSDGRNCWLFSLDKDNDARYDHAAFDAVADFYASIADPFALTHVPVETAIAKGKLIYQGQAQLDGRLCHRVQSWSVNQSPNEPGGVSAERIEWWIDAETFLPAQVVLAVPSLGIINRFHYSELNHAMPIAAFQPPLPFGGVIESSIWTNNVIEPDEKRFLHLKDGGSGEMAGRLGIRSPHRTVSGGLN